MIDRPKFPLDDLDLVGDGDEIDAIEDVERVFGVVLDKADAARWITAGDVYQSLLNALASADRNETEMTWSRFCVAICRATGLDPTRVAPETRLFPILEQPLSHRLMRWWRDLWATR